MNFELEEVRLKMFSNIFFFFRYWKKFWFIILCSAITTFYGLDLLLEYKEVGSGLTAIAISVAIMGWLTSARGADENMRRIKRIEYLSNAYEGIALYLRRDPKSIDYNIYLDGLEKSFTIIQLYGKRKEIKLVCSIIEQYNLSEEKNIQCDTLLNMLRDGLRDELLLPKATRYVRTMRVERPVLYEVNSSINTDLTMPCTK
ncbi:MAG: hypothetical protein Q8S21_01315 [Candidatus Paracaedibacteraceae bacterium]|nr:hypothetical protein [Candidatus Paracaedibacteraceae bacterium]